MVGVRAIPCTSFLSRCRSQASRARFRSWRGLSRQVEAAGHDIAYSSALPGADVLAMHGINDSLNKPSEDQELEDCLVQWCPSYRAAATAVGSAGGESN